MSLRRQGHLSARNAGYVGVCLAALTFLLMLGGHIATGFGVLALTVLLALAVVEPREP